MRHFRFATVLAGLLALFGGSEASAQAKAPTAAWSVSDCESCHDKALSPAYTKSAHAQQSQSCAQCHGSVAEHAKAMADGKDGPKPTLKGLKASEVNGRCLTCHEKGNQESYDASMHSRRNVACISCHSVHSPKSANAMLKTKNDAETCYSCHKAERSKMNKTSHHPVREGKMGCSSCHNPHDGNKPKMLKAESQTELCYSCHTEKRGPFLFEHAPVREDCATCHDAHGSNHARMLTQKMPTLCWNCHLTGSGHFGSGDNYSTEKGITLAPATPSGYPTVNSRFVGRSCAQCHLNIHGSNSPSGAYFIR